MLAVHGQARRARASAGSRVRPSPARRCGRRSRVAASAHSFDWQADSVLFRSSAATPSLWRYTGRDVPPRGHATMQINASLFHGAPSESGDTVEVVVKTLHLQAG